MSNYIKYGPPVFIDSWEREIRERWTEEAKKKNDRIIGDGYVKSANVGRRKLKRRTTALSATVTRNDRSRTRFRRLNQST